MFKWFRKFRQKSYAETKRELEVREEIYSSMSTLSDNQMEKWVQTRLELRNLREGGGVVRPLLSVERTNEN